MKIQQWLFELLRKQSVTDARTDGRTDNVKTVYPLQTKFAGGIISTFILWASQFEIKDEIWIHYWYTFLYNYKYHRMQKNIQNIFKNLQ